MLLITPVCFLLWHPKMSAVKNVLNPHSQCKTISRAVLRAVPPKCLQSLEPLEVVSFVKLDYLWGRVRVLTCIDQPLRDHRDVNSEWSLTSQTCTNHHSSLHYMWTELIKHCQCSGMKCDIFLLPFFSIPQLAAPLGDDWSLLLILLVGLEPYRATELQEERMESLLQIFPWRLEKSSVQSERRFVGVRYLTPC